MVSVNGNKSVTDFFSNLDRQDCQKLMNPAVTEVGGLDGSVALRLNATHVFHELVLGDTQEIVK